MLIRQRNLLLPNRDLLLDERLLSSGHLVLLLGEINRAFRKVRRNPAKHQQHDVAKDRVVLFQRGTVAIRP